MPKRKRSPGKTMEQEQPKRHALQEEPGFSRLEERREQEEHNPASDEEDDLSMKWKKPTLIDTLKAILKDYPANEQILKELIQNAEDAGAKTIKFLYDREKYPSDGLVEENLAAFQGPALYAYNDAMFSDDDFKNLVSIQNSNKVVDRSKVGRFGRGFKSVFHMTELPCLLSGRYLGKIDPTVEDKELMHKHSKLLLSHPNELKPYLGKFDFTEATCKRGLYKGTIFRFPLREIGHTYTVSDTVYTTEKITNIFETLKMQASMNLLFLKSLESIEVFTGGPSGKPQQKFCVSVGNRTDSRLQMRGSFFEEIATNLQKMERHLTYMVDINTLTGHSAVKTSQRFLVCHYYNSVKVSQTFKKLLSDKDLSNNPIVSVAMPLDNVSDNCSSVNEGHLFCFLPLPVDGKASPTGLPVHVNSFFAVDSKRSKIEWPTDQDGNQKLEDMPKELVWNHCLVTELLPEAYARLLQDATEEESVQGGDIYRYFPDIKEVNDKWRETLLPPFFRRALKMPLFPTVGGCNKDYVVLDDAVICPPCLDEELRHVLVKLLVKAGKKVVCPPEHVMEAIKKYCSPVEHVEVTPSYVRHILKSRHCYKELPRQEKLCLLKFLIKDNAFSDLRGLELLPAANGQFLMFCQTDSVYIVDDERRKLLPTLEALMLSTVLDSDLKRKLRSSCGQTQLKECSNEDCLKLLSKVFPSSCSKEVTIDCCKKGNYSHLTQEWVKQLWQFLVKVHEDNPRSLEKVAQLHILPIGSTSKLQLAKLSGDTVYVVQKHHSKTLEEEISKLLQYFGIQVLRALPDYVQHHPQIFDRDYIYQPHPESVMKALLKGTQALPKAQVSAMANEFNTKTTMGQRKAFRCFLHPAVDSVDGQFKSLLKQLKIFETIGRYKVMGKVSAAVVDVGIGVARYDLPTKPSKDLLDLSSQDSQALAQVLGVGTLTETEILEEIIFDDVGKHLWQPADLEKVMKPVLQKLDVHSKKSKTFIPRLKELAFLMDKTGENWRKPLELFDSGEEVLKKLFFGEDKFPGTAYAACIDALRQLGLKTEADISGDDLLSAASLIHDEIIVKSTALSISELEKKSRTIASVLQSKPRLQSNAVIAKLRDIEWIPVQSVKPSLFPTTVHWEIPKKLFAKPKSVYSSDHVSVIGLSLPTAKAGAFPDEVIELLAGDRPIPLESIISHLGKVVKSYTASQKPAFMKMACDTYNALKDFEGNEVIDELRRQNLVSWLWHGDGFTSADRLVIGTMSVALNMHPYVYSLPDELRQFDKDWLLHVGVRKVLELAAVLKEIQQWHSDHPSLATEERVRSDEDLAVRIINEIAKEIEQEGQENAQGNILVPVTGGTGLTLLPAKDCTYCDTKMDKSELSDLQKSFQEDKETIHYLHPAISKANATSLGVKSLDVGRLFDGSGLDFESEIEECGQHEPLTRRIARLLEENYRDGLVIPKELIQNADDAGATEIRFLFDERENREHCSGLLDDGMKIYQGPALWVYNNKTFTDEDLANIRKLSGATKEEKRDKIGQFGLGFNAVYNITDVPSFVTGKYIVFFDPHRTHLSKVLKNNDPGLKINLCVGTSRMALLKRQFANQFKPYNGIFNCSINETSEQGHYDATLFRLPLRPPGAQSEFKSRQYSKSDVRNLLQGLVEEANKLLLFTQNVKRIGIYHIPESGCKPSSPLRLFEAKCKTLKMFKRLPIPGGSNDRESPCGILKVADILLRAKTPPPKEPLHSSGMIETTSTIFPYKRHMEKDCFKLNGKSSNQTWLLFSCIGKEASLEFGRKLKSCSPVAGVAVKLQKTSQKVYEPQGYYPDGAPLFCHMPLPSTIRSGLPVIVNGSFALTSDRQHLLKQTSEDSTEWNICQWNQVLLDDAVVEAYLGTLEQVTSFIDVNRCDPYCLWPVKETLDSSFQPFYERFYAEIATGRGRSSKILNSVKGWIDFGHAVFLDEALARSQLKELALTLVQKYLDSRGEGKCAVVLPERIQHGFSNQKMEMFTLLQFYELAFFPVIGEVENPGRDDLVKRALVKCEKQGGLRQLVQSTACIAVEASSNKFLKPGELISPDGECGKLYGMEDERFPKDVFCLGRYSEVLKNLGMAVDEIPWKEVVQRAKSVQRLPAQSRSPRVSALLTYIERKVHRSKPDWDISTQLKEINFLPILQKPRSCPLSWKGDGLEHGAVGPAKCLYAQSHYQLIGNLSLILDEKQCGMQGKHRKTIFKLLGLDQKVPLLSDVVKTIDELSRLKVGSENKQGIETYIGKVYVYLDEYCYRDIIKEEEVKRLMRGKRCVLVQNHFMEPEYIAKDCEKLHAQPYLSCVPDTIRGLGNLQKALGIKDEFNSNDYIDALHRIKADNLTEDKVNMVRDIAECLRDKVQHASGGPTTATPENPILLPADTHSQHKRKSSRNDLMLLLPVDQLCLRENSKSWLNISDQNLKYLHPAIPHRTAGELGVKSDCESVMASLGCGFGEPFGQKEKLTTRIKGILQGYPCDEGVLKELLQNADDAGATELKFILDHKGQHGDKVMSEAWAELQGPALCVHNNKPFTEKDLKGICNLGLGSKNTDPTKTGQYGIGFNSVYHLTDVPSFLTEGEEIGRTIGIFDPNCRFIPGATTENPGRCFRREDAAKVTAKFPGSFSGYLEDNFPVEGATTFRLPLRTKESAEQSKIRNKPVTFEDIETFFQKLHTEVFQCLLFVNSVRNITFHNTKTKATYWVRVTISPADQVALANFTKHMKSVSAQLKEGQVGLKDVAYQEVIYTLTFVDSKKRKEEWSVCQCIGFKDGSNIPHKVQAAYTCGDISLLPRGGAAFCKNQPARSKREHLMFCFLPLPLPQDTHLPFHINGHFALDANRRSLWGPSGGPSDHCYRTAWNKLIIEECIAKACMSLVNAECDHLKRKTCPSRTDLNNLYSLFPHLSGSHEEGYAKHLTSAFYREMTLSESACLVAVAMHDQTNKFVGRWFTVQDCIAGKVVFDNPDEEPKMANEHLHARRGKLVERHGPHTSEKLTVAKTLSRLGYNILEAVPHFQFIFRELRHVDKNVKQVSQDHVLEFLRQYLTHPESTLKNLPQHISESPFMNISNLVKIIRYCLPQDCSLSLSGLPLCLTKDEVLRVFDEEVTVFPPTFSMLIPERADRFVEKDIYDAVVGQIDNDRSVKLFKIHNFAVLIRERQEYQHFLQERPLELDRSGEGGERLGSWLQNLWKLIKQELGDMFLLNPSLMWVGFMSPILDFRIIPAHIEPDDKYVLYRVRDAKQVVHPTDRASAYFMDILPLLKKLGVPMLELTLCTEQDSIRSKREIAEVIVSHQEDGVGILNALWHLHQQGLLQVTSKPAANILLEYFSNYFHEYESRLGKDLVPRLDSTQLLAIPIHITVNGSIVSFEGRTAFLIPPGIPKAGLDNCFTDRANKTKQFIYKGSKKLVAMYEDCGCCNKNEVEVYIELLLLEINFCEFLTEEERLEHLMFIVDWVLPKLDEQSTKYKALMAALQNLPFVTDREGQLRRAEELYNPEVPLYALMEKDFPSEKFRQRKLVDLLKKCCLKTTVTPDELLKYAEMVEAEAQADPTDETVVRKSKLIFVELGVMDPKPTEAQLFKMKNIAFIPVEKCAPKLTNLHPQHLLPPGSVGAFTCFQDSMLYDECDKCWTVAPILPSWINASHRMTDVLTKLGVPYPVPVKTVVAHCTRLSQHLCSSNMAQKSSKDVMKYMTVLYDYFKERKDSLEESDYKELGNAPCIAVDEGQSLIHPRQVCPELPFDREMKPYLYKLPRDLGPFYDHLFRKLGVREHPDFRHYMDVLKVIHGECEGGELVLDCNQERSAKQAITNFMQWIQKEDDPSLEPDDSLYLLSRRNTLERSTEMVLVDDPRLLPGQAKEIVGYQVVDNIPGCTVHHLQRLPECIRPKLLSTLIEEVLDDSITYVAVQGSDSGAVSCFRVRLKSLSFLDGLKRLLHHDSTSKGERMEVFNECWSKLQDILTNIKFFTVPKIVTVLRSRGASVILPDSMQESRKVFINMTEGCKVYIQQNEEEIMLRRVQEQIAKCINTMMRITGDTALILVEILKCHLHQISETLDDNHITGDDEGTASCEPELGSFIPLVQHCLLKPDYVVFVVGEIVGLERDDPLNDGRDGPATYMYAKIIRRIRSDGDDKDEEMGFKYEIDVGDSTIIVTAWDLFKFTRKRAETLTDKPFNLDEEKKKITADLKYALHSNSLTEEEQKKFLKRLVMKWQMESNRGVADEILQFIEDELDRLQNENKAKGSTSGRRYFSHPWFSTSHIFQYARERAQKHRTQIETFRQQESCTSSNPLDFSYLRYRGKNPQPGEARRWFRQANADLAASKADDTYGTEKAYEWALQKCHQAAEKALKAASYTLDSTRRISHNLPYIASPLSNQRISELAVNINGKISDGMALRYPDRLSYPSIPHDSYDENTFRQVFEWTNQLLNVIEDKFKLNPI